jgi:hypothetical protein
VEEAMARRSVTKKPLRKPKVSTGGRAKPLLQSLLWRLDRLERQVRTLSELVRDHAEDEDRLVQIVGEDHEVLRQELLGEHQTKSLARKRPRSVSSKSQFDR